MTVQALLTRIEDALDRGDFSELALAAPLLEPAIAGLRGEGADLAAMRAQAVRMSRRLRSAAEGVRAARWRLDDIRAMGTSGDRLVTYDVQGQRRDSGAGTSLTRRF